ncbi:unnamed protein product [Symbiodinium natans]|uniref:Uncharacterized protein n=1 Tax=Symbiodinium natans TaxID=878477 RepID=A0A812RDI7_9DINO|nr:unnamed protein product [Symbiodinium natans]
MAAMVFKSSRLAQGCSILAILALVAVLQCFREDQHGVVQAPSPSRFAPARALKAQNDAHIQKADELEPAVLDGREDLPVEVVEQFETVEASTLKGNESSALTAAVLSEDLSTTSIAQQESLTSTSSFEQQSTETAENPPAARMEHLEGSWSQTTADMIAEDGIQLYQKSITVLKDAAVSSEEASGHSLDELAIFGDCPCTSILAGERPPANADCLRNCSSVVQHGGMRINLPDGPLAFPHEHDEL